jgi:hypothetical protein
LSSFAPGENWAIQCTVNDRLSYTEEPGKWRLSEVSIHSRYWRCAGRTQCVKRLAMEKSSRMRIPALSNISFIIGTSLNEADTLLWTKASTGWTIVDAGQPLYRDYIECKDDFGPSTCEAKSLGGN